MNGKKFNNDITAEHKQHQGLLQLKSRITVTYQVQACNHQLGVVGRLSQAKNYMEELQKC